MSETTYLDAFGREKAYAVNDSPSPAPTQHEHFIHQPFWVPGQEPVEANAAEGIEPREGVVNTPEVEDWVIEGWRAQHELEGHTKDFKVTAPLWRNVDGHPQGGFWVVYSEAQ